MSTTYKLIKDYPGKKIGDTCRYDPQIDEFHFLWDSNRDIIPRQFQPDVTPEWFQPIIDPTFFCDIDMAIKSQIYDIFEKLGFGAEMLRVIGSWKNTMSSEFVLSELIVISENLDNFKLK